MTQFNNGYSNNNYSNGSNGRNGYEDNRRKTYTNGPHFKNPTGVIQSTALEVVYYDDMVRLQFSKELPISDQSKWRKFDYQNAVMTSLTRIKCNELCNIYQAVVRPALLRGEEIMQGIPLGDANMLQIGGIKDSEGKLHAVLRFIKIPNPDVSRLPEPENIIYYEFKPCVVITEYNTTTGDYEAYDNIVSEMDLFICDMKNATHASSIAYVHHDRVVNRSYTERVESTLNALAGSAGIPTGKPQNSRFNNDDDGTIFTSNKPRSAEGEYKPVYTAAEAPESLKQAMDILDL